MGTISVQGLGKAYKFYPTRWSRLVEWFSPYPANHHTLKWVLRDVDFTVKAGEAVGIVGVNGAGKSTLLKIITGTTKPSEGIYSITGSVAAMLELGMGFHPDFTGRQNALMAAQLLGISSEEMISLMPKIQEFAEIGDYFDQPLRIYSSGMSVRLAFAVSSAKRPDILIIDEALSVGDAYFQQKSFKRIRQFQADGTTLLLVSHDVAAVRSICQQAVWLEKGRIRGRGKTKDVLDLYAASLYEKNQDIHSASVSSNSALPSEQSKPVWVRDARQDFINNSGLRNDIEVFSFEPELNGWGDAAAKIIDVKITDNHGNSFCWMIGGEEITLRVEAQALRDIESVVIGFLVRDRLGQALFGDNTFLTRIANPMRAQKGQTIVAHFKFLMPILPHGSYSVTTAVATGTQDSHVINDWRDQCVRFESYNRSAVSGMIGIPMHQIELSVN